MEPMKRLLEYVPDDGVAPQQIEVRIHVPEQRDAMVWIAVVEIVGFDEEHRMPVVGVDAIQAILLAARHASAVLGYFARKGGHLTWHGSDDLGFPPAIEGRSP